MISPFEAAVPSHVSVLEFPELESLNATLAERNEEAERRKREAMRDAEKMRALEQQRQRELDLAREEGMQAGHARAEAHFRESLDIERTGLALAATGFARARERYFAEVEAEVVKLSLTIAARILQREVSVDPVALAGVVRVALAKLGDAEGAVLHASADDAERWRRALKTLNLRVEADAALRSGELQLRGRGSIADLGLDAQLAEIERGFFDLLNKRPA